MRSPKARSVFMIEILLPILFQTRGLVHLCRVLSTIVFLYLTRRLYGVLIWVTKRNRLV